MPAAQTPSLLGCLTRSRAAGLGALTTTWQRRRHLDGALLGDEARVDGQLVRREHQRFLGQVLADTCHLEDDPARPHDADIMVRRALAAAHTRFRRLGSDHLVWEDPDPNLAATLEVVGDGATRGLDLPAFQPARLERL